MVNPSSGREPSSRRRGAGPREIDPRVLQETALRYFVEVAHAGSVSAAAVRLDVAPSAVSRQIARLERGLDTLLFDRHARGMSLNGAGELLAAYARRGRQDAERVAQEIVALRGLRRGTVRVAATEGFAHEFLPTLAARFQQRHPGVVFAIDMGLQHEVAQAVRSGDADLGVTVSLLAERDLVVQLRHPSPVLAVVARDHPLAGRRQVTLAQVAAFPLALPGPASTLRRLLDVGFSRQQLDTQVVLTSNRLFPLVHHAAASRAVTFCGALALRGHLARGTVRALPLRDREMKERHFEVLSRAGRPLSDAARAFVDHLRADVASR